MHVSTTHELTLAIVGLERKAVRDTVLPSGKTILRGSHLAVDSSLMWSSDVYSNPEDFNARRFLDLREQHGPTHVFTASSREHNTFGMGKHICPGRFFADSELKVCLAQVLLKYDFRFADGHVGDPLYLGFSPIVAPGARVEVRRRR
jgi:cytochrome P450